MNDFHVIIPARYQSTRFPGKLLMDLAGKTVLERVYLQALKAKPSSIVIATDSADIAGHAQNIGAEVMLTSAEHQTGTDRIAEVVKKKGYADDAIIVNVQGDEPFIAPELIEQVARILSATDVPMATLCWPIETLPQLQSPHVVKVVRDSHNHALYFSRSPIPAHRDNSDSITHAYRHIGLYAYRSRFLLDYVEWPMCNIESCEALEQLRVLWAGYKIRVDVACTMPKQDINTAEDLAAAQKLCDKGS